MSTTVGVTAAADIVSEDGRGAPEKVPAVPMRVATLFIIACSVPGTGRVTSAQVESVAAYARK
jgi:hypothetical protein